MSETKTLNIDGGSHAKHHDADTSKKDHHATAGPVLIEGWLNKEGHGKKASKFSKRWVVVQENELRYYKSPTDEHPKGVQALALMRVDNIDTRGQMMTIKNLDGREFRLKAITPLPSFVTWMEVLEEACQMALETFEMKFDAVLKAHRQSPDHFSPGVSALFEEMVATQLTSESITEANRKEAGMFMYAKRNQLIKETGEDVAIDGDLLDPHNDFDAVVVSFGALGSLQIVPNDSDAAAGATTDVSASKAKTRGALLTGLRNGKLEAAVAKMEDDVAVEESIGAK